MRALLFSGGMDSTALAWMMRPELLVFVDYGQVPAPGERRAAESIADALQLDLRIVEADIVALGAGPLAGRAPNDGAAPENWPFRNQHLVTIAAMALASERPAAIVLGSVGEDAVHPDGSREFVEALDRLVRLQGGPAIEAPAIGMTASELLRSSGLPVEIAGYTFSCHAAEWACGSCRGCFKHAEAMVFLAEGASRPVDVMDGVRQPRAAD